jgi:trimeric autotransporter adhesin
LASPFQVTTQSNRIVLGDNSITNAYIQVAWTVTSDLRDKTEIENIPHGLAFVDKLKPVSFKFKKSREDDTPHGTKHYGFLAQDILELEGSDNVIIDNEQPEKLKYKGEHLVPILVNAIKELKAEIELLKNK